MSRDFDFAEGYDEDDFNVIASAHNLHNGRLPFCEGCRLIATVKEWRDKFNAVSGAEEKAELLAALKDATNKRKFAEQQLEGYKRAHPDRPNYGDQYGVPRYR